MHFPIVLIICLAASFAHCLTELKLWIKPEGYLYTVNIACVRFKQKIVIASVTHDRISMAEQPQAKGMLFIPVDYSKCDRNIFQILIQINQRFDIQMDKQVAIHRRSAIVLNVGIQPVAHKTFYLHESPQLPAATDNANFSFNHLFVYELELSCYLVQKETGEKEFYLIGSGVQNNQQKGISIPVYDIELLKSCTEVSIDVFFSDGSKKQLLFQKDEDISSSHIFNVDLDSEQILIP